MWGTGMGVEEWDRDFQRLARRVRWGEPKAPVRPIAAAPWAVESPLNDLSNAVARLADEPERIEMSRSVSV